MSTDKNLELIHRMYEALNAQDLEAHDEFWTEDMIWHGPPAFGDIHGLEAFKNEVLKPFYAAFPDYHVKNDIEVADGNWVAATGYLTATHQGEWLGIAATGKPVKMRFSDFWLVKDGLLSENWVMTDDLEVMRQLGVDPLAQMKSV
jgi:predicted ester cyclase